MNNYQGLKNLCSIWMMIAVIGGGLVGISGGISLFSGNLTGLAYIIGAIVAILIAQTLDYVIHLLIDIAVSLQRPPEKNEIEPATVAPAPSVIRKLPKG